MRRGRCDSRGYAVCHVPAWRRGGCVGGEGEEEARAGELSSLPCKLIGASYGSAQAFPGRYFHRVKVADTSVGFF